MQLPVSFASGAGGVTGVYYSKGHCTAKVIALVVHRALYGEHPKLVFEKSRQSFKAIVLTKRPRFNFWGGGDTESTDERAPYSLGLSKFARCGSEQLREIRETVLIYSYSIHVGQ